MLANATLEEADAMEVMTSCGMSSSRMLPTSIHERGM